MTVALSDDYVSELQDLSPPNEVADAHDEVVAALQEGRDRMLELAEETADDVPGMDLSDIFYTISQDPDNGWFDAANCALVAIARPPGITLDRVGCRQ